MNKEDVVLIASIVLVFSLFFYALYCAFGFDKMIIEDDMMIFEIYKPDSNPEYTWIHTYGKGFYLVVDQEINMTEGKTYRIIYYHVDKINQWHIYIMDYYQLN